MDYSGIREDLEKVIKILSSSARGFITEPKVDFVGTTSDYFFIAAKSLISLIDRTGVRISGKGITLSKKVAISPETKEAMKYAQGLAFFIADPVTNISRFADFVEQDTKGQGAPVRKNNLLQGFATKFADDIVDIDQQKNLAIRIQALVKILRDLPVRSVSESSSGRIDVVKEEDIKVTRSSAKTPTGLVAKAIRQEYGVESDSSFFPSVRIVKMQDYGAQSFYRIEVYDLFDKDNLSKKLEISPGSMISYESKHKGYNVFLIPKEVLDAQVKAVFLGEKLVAKASRGEVNSVSGDQRSGKVYYKIVADGSFAGCFESLGINEKKVTQIPRKIGDGSVTTFLVSEEELLKSSLKSILSKMNRVLDKGTSRTSGLGRA